MVKRLWRDIAAPLVILGLGGLSATNGFAQIIDVPGAKPCHAVQPTITRTAPAHWLGDCSEGRAEGIGVLRIGTHEPFEYFFGAAHAGRPVRGLIKAANGWYAATRFDARMNMVNPRSEDPNEAHATYILAVKATQATARRFAMAGNRGSARYYERLAKQIADGEPE